MRLRTYTYNKKLVLINRCTNYRAIMGFLIYFAKYVFMFSASFFDVSSDLVNSLDFLGYNVASKITQKIMGSSEVLAENNNQYLMPDIFETNTNITTVDPYNWGIVGMGIIFLPGLIGGLPYLLIFIDRRLWRWALLVLLVSCTFPIALLLVQLLTIFYVYKNSDACKDHQMYLTAAIGMEACLESFSQLLLQIYTILYGYKVTTTQIITILASFFLIARTSMLLDIETKMYSMGKELSFGESLLQTFKRMPCYTSTIIFRVSAVSLTIAFLRGWSAIPISILFLELAILAYMRNKNQEDRSEARAATFYLCLSNAGVMNAYTLGTDDEDEVGGEKFIRNSTIVTFIHHSIVLVTIMIVASYNPQYLDHWTWPEFQLKPTVCHFFTVFGCTLFMGCYSLTVTLYRAKNIVNVDVENKLEI